MEESRSSTATAALLSVRTSRYPFRALRTDGHDQDEALLRPGDADPWINGGYSRLRREVFDVIEPGDRYEGSGGRWTRFATSSTWRGSPPQATPRGLAWEKRP